ncbi:MAG: CidA/LrgA family protein [Arenicellales bacterium]
MLEYFTLILACQLIGELVITTLDLPLPGPVVGMIMLFVFLTVRGTVPDSLANVSDALLSNLSLLFVPAGVGVMVHFELLGADAWPLSVALIASTLLTIAVTAILMVLLNKHAARKARSNQGKA